MDGASEHLLELGPIQSAKDVDDGAAGAGSSKQGARGVQSQKGKRLLMSLDIITPSPIEFFDTDFPCSLMAQAGQDIRVGVHEIRRGGCHHALDVTRGFEFINLPEPRLIDIDFEFGDHDDVIGHQSHGAHCASKSELAMLIILSLVVQEDDVLVASAHKRILFRFVQNLHDRHPPLPPIQPRGCLLERVGAVRFKP